jgi:hypothetical protein
MKCIIEKISFAGVFGYNVDLYMLHGSADDDSCILQKKSYETIN